MSDRDSLKLEIESAPEHVIAEVLDFVRFLKSKRLTKLEEATLSEPRIAKEWLLPEEEAAWSSL
jgi:hypothetical protein